MTKWTAARALEELTALPRLPC